MAVGRIDAVLEIAGADLDGALDLAVALGNEPERAGAVLVLQVVGIEAGIVIKEIRVLGAGKKTREMNAGLYEIGRRLPGRRGLLEFLDIGIPVRRVERRIWE